MMQILESAIVTALLGVIIFFLQRMVSKQDATNEKLEKVLVNDGKQDQRIERIEDDVDELKTDVKQLQKQKS